MMKVFPYLNIYYWFQDDDNKSGTSYEYLGYVLYALRGLYSRPVKFWVYSYFISWHSIAGVFLYLYQVVKILPSTRHISTIYGVTEYVRCEYFYCRHDRLGGIAQRL